VKVKPPTSKGIEIGSKVQEHGKDSLCWFGTVISDDQEDKGKSHWTVLFDGKSDPVASIPSTKLQLVKDDRVFEWTTIQDWIPKDHEQPKPYKDHGIVGFNFQQMLETKQFESNRVHTNTRSWCFFSICGLATGECSLAVSTTTFPMKRASL
jgi:hypothetical protein